MPKRIRRLRTGGRVEPRRLAQARGLRGLDLRGLANLSRYEFVINAPSPVVLEGIKEDNDRA